MTGNKPDTRETSAFKKCPKCEGDRFTEFRIEGTSRKGVRIMDTGRVNYDNAGRERIVRNDIEENFYECEECSMVYTLFGDMLYSESLQPGQICVFAAPALPVGDAEIPLRQLGFISELPMFEVSKDGLLHSILLRCIFMQNVWLNLCNAPFGLVLQQRTCGGDYLKGMYLEQVGFGEPVTEISHHNGTIVLELVPCVCARVISIDEKLQKGGHINYA